MSNHVSFFVAFGKRATLDLKVYGMGGNPLGIFQLDEYQIDEFDSWETIERICDVLVKSSDSRIKNLAVNFLHDCDGVEYSVERFQYLFNLVLDINRLDYDTDAVTPKALYVSRYAIKFAMEWAERTGRFALLNPNGLFSEEKKTL